MPCRSVVWLPQNSPSHRFWAGSERPDQSGLYRRFAAMAGGWVWRCLEKNDSRLIYTSAPLSCLLRLT